MFWASDPVSMRCEKNFLVRRGVNRLCFGFSFWFSRCFAVFLACALGAFLCCYARRLMLLNVTFLHHSRGVVIFDCFMAFAFVDFFGRCIILISFEFPTLLLC